MLKCGGGGTKRFEVVLTRELISFSHTDGGGGTHCFHPLEGGGGREKFYPVLKGERAQKV